MPEEAKPTQNNKPNDKQNNRPKHNRGNPRGRSNRGSKPHTTQSRPANPFEVTAAYHTARANFWRRRINGFAAFTVIYGALLAATKASLSASFIIGLGLISFTLIFLLLVAARNYHDHKRNIDANRYRQNILITAEDMAKSTRDIETKEEIMLEALTLLGDNDQD